MTLSKKAVWLYGLLFIAVLAIPATAQTTATLAGRVTDERRAAVSGAIVEAVNRATNATLTAATNEDGRYVFAELQPGVYRLTARLAGFQTTVKEEVTLNVAARAAQDFTLRVGEVTATVTVEDTPTLVERDSATVSTVVT